MKKAACALVTLIVCLFGLSSLSYAAYLPEAEEQFDGYLVHIDNSRTMDLTAENELDAVLPGVWYTQDAALAASLLDEGAVLEPNYEMKLFSMEYADQGVASGANGGEYAAELGLTGAGVRIAVIDSGVNTDNPNLKNALILDGYDYLNPTASMSDDLGHGTCVVQMIAGDGSDSRVRGIAPQVEIVPLRCFDAQSTTYILDLAKAIRDAVDVYDCDIINMSWGNSTDYLTLHEAVQYAAQEGVITVAAAGNVQSDLPQGQLFYPAAYEEVIGVGAIYSDMQSSPTTQHTAAVSVCAVGMNISFARNGGTTQASGTSFAAPAAAATIALVKQFLPTADSKLLTELFTGRSLDLGEPGYDTTFGYGYFSPEVLFNAPWCSIGLEEGTATASGWLRSDSGGSVISALYGSDSQLLLCRVVSGDTAIFGFQQAFPVAAELGEVKVFFLNADLRPLTAPGRKPIQTTA